MPIEKLEDGAWLHRSRLPLGCGWRGHCTAPGHESELPSREELQDFCNLGYARGCRRLPGDRTWDSVRFGARTSGDGKKNHIYVRYICEREHRPVENGFLEFDAVEARWEKTHADIRVQRMAECFLQSYIENRKNQPATQAAAS